MLNLTGEEKNATLREGITVHHAFMQVLNLRPLALQIICR